MDNSISFGLVVEMQHEAATARKCLERIPAEKFDWKPHETSFSFVQLASHIAEMFGWTPMTMQEDGLDFAKWDYVPFVPTTPAELVEFFDKNVAAAIEVLEGSSNERFAENWTMQNGEEIFFTMPKIAVMRSFVMNHIIHHRGQLTVYMRINEIAIPSIYGPSGDEKS